MRRSTHTRYETGGAGWLYRKVAPITSAAPATKLDVHTASPNTAADTSADRIMDAAEAKFFATTSACLPA